MKVTFRISGVRRELPVADAAAISEELRAIGDGFRGDWAGPDVAYALADAIDDRLDVGDDEPIAVTDPDSLEALQRALNSVIHEIGAAMELHNAVDMARRAA